MKSNGQVGEFQFVFVPIRFSRCDKCESAFDANCRKFLGEYRRSIVGKTKCSRAREKFGKTIGHWVTRFFGNLFLLVFAKNRITFSRGDRFWLDDQNVAGWGDGSDIEHSKDGTRLFTTSSESSTTIGHREKSARSTSFTDNDVFIEEWFQQIWSDSVQVKPSFFF